MTITWNDSVPIYRQLRERVVAMILDGALNEGDPLPSVRQVAADFQINPLTVSKAYQELVDDQLVEKRRGLGMFVIDGAREALLKSERERFLREEWPSLFARLQRLGLDLKTLLREAPGHGSANGENRHERGCDGHGSDQAIQEHPRLGRCELSDRVRPHRRADRTQRRRQDHGAEGDPRPDRFPGRAERTRL